MEPLTPEERHVIEDKGTEAPFSGEYDTFFENGIYVCRRCLNPLYRSLDKFSSLCGWPSFDDHLPKGVKKELDQDGKRTEILCASCNGHLGHVFEGEKLTQKNTRHCVNSLSMRFLSFETLLDMSLANHPRFDVAFVAGGCFWGVEFFFTKEKGVLATQVGYSGGDLDHPTYQQVCSSDTGHVETVAVIYDKQENNVHDLYTLFFNIHDPTQEDRQGPDQGSQYRSVIFYRNLDQKKEAAACIQALHAKKIDAVTKLVVFKTFWPAENAHQKYYQKTGKLPYCHTKVIRLP